jgi:hypothetical protein
MMRLDGTVVEPVVGPGEHDRGPAVSPTLR